MNSVSIRGIWILNLSSVIWGDLGCFGALDESYRQIVLRQGAVFAAGFD